MGLDMSATLVVRHPVTDYAGRERERESKRNLENAQAAIRNMQVEGLVDARQLADSFTEGAGYRATAAELAVSDRTWTFGHIVVDEAQELSPMQWRLLVRKNPLKSFTIVGDVAQVASAAGTGDWASALGPVFKDAWRLENLSVNYRTPAQISEAAEAMAASNGVPITRTTAVREGDWPVEVIRVGSSLVESPAAGDSAQSASALDDPTVDAILDAVAAMRAEGGGAGEAGSVVEPAAIVADGPRGAGALYVAMTRATQRLTLITSGPLPTGIPYF